MFQPQFMVAVENLSPPPITLVLTEWPQSAHKRLALFPTPHPVNFYLFITLMSFPQHPQLELTTDQVVEHLYLQQLQQLLRVMLQSNHHLYTPTHTMFWPINLELFRADIQETCPNYNITWLASNLAILIPRIRDIMAAGVKPKRLTPKI